MPPVDASEPDPAAEAALVARIIGGLRPMFQRDGGDIALVEVTAARVLVRLSGACAGCMLAGQTLGVVQRDVSAGLGRPIRVIPVPARAGLP